MDNIASFSQKRLEVLSPEEIFHIYDRLPLEQAETPILKWKAIVPWSKKYVAGIRRRYNDPSHPCAAGGLSLVHGDRLYRAGSMVEAMYNNLKSMALRIPQQSLDKSLSANDLCSDTTTQCEYLSQVILLNGLFTHMCCAFSGCSRNHPESRRDILPGRRRITTKGGDAAALSKRLPQ